MKNNKIKISGKIGGIIIDANNIKISRGNICISDGDNVIWIPKDITDKIITKIKG